MNETYIDKNTCIKWSDVKLEYRPDLIPWDVWRLFIPKNNKILFTVWIQSLDDLGKLINSWNSVQPGIWQYWY
jgi:hypothetical protein